MRGWIVPLALVAACDSPLPGPAEWNRPVERPDDAEAATQRAACAYKRGALPSETQGKSTPYGRDIPIDHVIVIMMENRSFDHYFQKLPENGQPDVEVAPAGFTNPDFDGKPVGLVRDTQHCFVDTAHGWNAVHEQIDGGKMDGFFKTNDGTHELPMGGSMELLSGQRGLAYYEPGDLPFMYWAANHFAVADHYFSSVPGPTWPNRAYLYGATSRGKTRNEFVMNNLDTLFDYLELRKVPWTIYMHRLPGFGVFVDRLLYYYNLNDELERVKRINRFYEDLVAGTLPPVAFVDPDLGHSWGGSNDDHPPAMMSLGQKFLADVVEAVMKSKHWKRTAIFITYDEHGGLYDHVAPPKACPPDDIAAELDANDEKGGFDELGVRVPLVVISPYAKKKFVGHRVYDHTSIARFIEARFELPAMSHRDANAEAPWELFDFRNPPNETPPAVPPVPIDMAKVSACNALFPDDRPGPTPPAM